MHLIFEVPVPQIQERVVASPRSLPRDETVTLQRERIFFCRAGDSTGGRAKFDSGDITAVVLSFQLVLEDTFLNWVLWFAFESASDSTGGRAHNPLSPHPFPR